MKNVTRVVRQIYAISAVTFQELLREKILWSAFVFALLCISLSFAVSQLSFVDGSRIALDFGLASVSIIGGLMSVIMGAALIAKEVQNRTLYLVLTKSIWRWQFVVGRFLGLLAILLLNALLMTVVVIGVVRMTEGSVDAAVAQSLLLQMTEFGVLAAMACIFSAFSTPTLAAIFSSGIWVIGHAMTDLRVLANRIEPAEIRPLLGALARVLPDLTRFDVKAEVAHNIPITWTYTGVSVAYGMAYMIFALVVACVIFLRRDL